MFFSNQTNEQKVEYEKFLKIIGSFSKLFSSSNIPYLYYRVAENIFCKAFDAEDLSRSDIAVDAKKIKTGIALKTFLASNNKTLQKVGEFNSDRQLYENLKPDELVRKVSELRNIRIAFAKQAYGLKECIYHCVLREEGRFLIYEEPMYEIDLQKIVKVKHKDNVISFNDGKNDYSFLLSKSTLTKRFVTKPIEYDFNVKILDDPLQDLDKLLKNEKLLFDTTSQIQATVYLPLYSSKDGEVPEKSGLNQWNAAGRQRDPSEVYIPIPSMVHKIAPSFFPNRDTPFILRLPDGKEMKSKVCQAGNKALMSQSNRELGQWILRDILHLKERELFTTKKMLELGIDSVRIDKVSDSIYQISFSEISSYETWVSLH